MNRKTVIFMLMIAAAAALYSCGPAAEIDVRPSDGILQKKITEPVSGTGVYETSEVTSASENPETLRAETAPAVTAQARVISEKKGVENSQDNKNNSNSSHSSSVQNHENNTVNNQNSAGSSPAENRQEEKKEQKKEETRKPEETSAPVQVTEAKTQTEATEAPVQATASPELKYVNGILVVNKSYPVPEDYRPDGMVISYRSIDGTDYLLPEVSDAFRELCDAADGDGYYLWCQSAFRSYATQKRLYNNYAASDGKEAADRYSARPGYSEHHTGYALDVNYPSSSFNNTPEAAWIAENCWKYGFILRYPADKEAQTGYKYESWHIRYVGKELSEDIYNSGLCLEEYFGLSSQYSD